MFIPVTTPAPNDTNNVKPRDANWYRAWSVAVLPPYMLQGKETMI